MHRGLIHISEPIYCSKDELICIEDDQKKLVCLLEGKLMTTTKNILKGGDVFGYDYIIEERHPKTSLTALEDSKIITIEGENINLLLSNDQEIVKNIINSTLEYISEMKDHLKY